MIDFIPLALYYDVFLYVCMFFVLINLLYATSVGLDSEQNLKFLQSSGIILFILVLLYLGLRPVSGRAFGDMGTYYNYFQGYASGLPISTNQDITFHIYMNFLSNFVGYIGFFVISEFMYLFPMVLISKKHFKSYWFYAFLMLIVSFSFYTYATNGVRNGLGTSLFLWGLCYPKNKIKMGLFFLLAVLFHKSLLLPVLAYCLTLIYNEPKTYLKFWLLAIPLSLVMGSIWISLFTSLGFGDDRLAGYITGEGSSDDAIITGFRWDFLFYSAFAIFAGWYFIIKRNFKDVFYNQIFNTYLICNAFWVLVIRANYSNRFAYLSWFLMGFIIIYPLLKQQFFKNQQLMIAKVILAYFAFTFLMNVIYYAN